MIRSFCAVTVLGLLLPGISLGEETCPWMNTATASGLLGGDVTVRVNHASKNKEDANCDFGRQQGTLIYQLGIQVETMASPSAFGAFVAPCAAEGTRLKGIGNEAFACSLGKYGQLSEQVVGRVRDRAFVVRASTNDPAAAQASFREKVTKAAEQVAGNLF